LKFNAKKKTEMHTMNTNSYRAKAVPESSDSFCTNRAQIFDIWYGMGGMQQSDDFANGDFSTPTQNLQFARKTDRQDVQAHRCLYGKKHDMGCCVEQERVVGFFVVTEKT
jgi:hypothetical protein